MRRDQFPQYHQRPPYKPPPIKPLFIAETPSYGSHAPPLRYHQPHDYRLRDRDRQEGLTVYNKQRTQPPRETLRNEVIHPSQVKPQQRVYAQDFKPQIEPLVKVQNLIEPKTHQKPIHRPTQERKPDYQARFKNCPKVSHQESSIQTKTVEPIQKKKLTAEESVRAGFPNLGNTCYMNSLLQCLFHIPQFQEQLFSNKEVVGKPLSLRLSNLLLQHLSTKLVDFDDLKDFKIYIDESLPQFRGFKQQDAQEFFQALRKFIHFELNQAKEKSKLSRQLSAQSPYSPQAQNYLSSRAKVHFSLMSRLFQGLFINQISCKCGYRHATLQVFDEICLHLKDEEQTDVECLLQNFLQAESLQNKECQKCGQRDSSSLKSSVYKFPQVLIILIKRFTFIEAKGYKLKHKVNLNAELSLQQQRFKLGGAVLHEGEIQSGHYTALSLNRDSESWWLCNDRKVLQSRPEDIDSQQTYIAFYQRI